MKIETDEEYQKALRELGAIFEIIDADISKADTSFNELMDAIEDYEDIHYPISCNAEVV